MRNIVVRHNDRSENIFNHLDVLIKSPPKVLIDFLYELDLSLPRALRMSALHSVLDPELKEEYEALKAKRKEAGKLGLIDYQRHKRLHFLDALSETQLENELYASGDERNYEYMKKIWENILAFLDDDGIPHKDIGLLLTSASAETEAGPDTRQFNDLTHPYFHDEEGKLDGIAIERLREVLNETSTVKEVTRLGKKYDVIVPQTLKRDEIAAIILAELENKNLLTAGLKAKIKTGKTRELEKIAAEHAINASSYMTKEKAIDHLLTHAEKTSAHYAPGTGDEKAASEAEARRLRAAQRCSVSKESFAALQEEIGALRKLLEQNAAMLGEKTAKEAKTDQRAVKKRPLLRLMTIAIIIGLILLSLATATYFFEESAVFGWFSDIMNTFTFRERGLMELYHRMLGFIFKGS